MSHRIRLTAAPLLTALLLAMAAAPVWAEPNDGVVTGQVLNKTAGGGPTAGATVTLVSFGRKEQKPLGQRSCAKCSRHASSVRNRAANSKSPVIRSRPQWSRKCYSEAKLETRTFREPVLPGQGDGLITNAFII